MKAFVSRRVALLSAAFGCLVWAGAAQAAPESFHVQLSGQQQVPVVQTKGHGTADLTYDPTTRVISWSITYSGLSSPVTMAHFHGPAAAGKNGPVEVWLSKKGKPVGKTMKGKATLNTKEAQQLAGGDMYINVHTKDHPAGEIRGQVVLPKK
ncbi:MAG: CHRD domain-containing protein [Bradyrhizobium sp.]